MKIWRLRGLLLWEIGGFVVEGKNRGFSVSLVRPSYWRFGQQKYVRLREVFLGPVVFIFYHVRVRED